MVASGRRIESSRLAWIKTHQAYTWLVIGIGAFLRFITLGRQSLWLDEGVTFWTINRSFSDLIQLITDSFRPLYFYVLYPFASVTRSEWMLRFPSALAGLISLVLLYWMGKELFDHRTSLIAALLLAVSPLHIWYSQEARMYAQVGMLTLAAILFAVRAIRTNHGLNWLLFGLFEALALWTESAAVWFVMAVNLAALIAIIPLWKKRRLAGWAFSQIFAFIFYLPGVLIFMRTIQGSDTLWIPPATITAFFRTLADLAGAFQGTRWQGFLALLLLAAVLLLGARWTLPETRQKFLVYLLLISWFAVPLAISFFISQPYIRPAFLEAVFGQRKSIFLTRNLITALFPLLLLLSRSLVLTPSKLVRNGLLFGMLALSITGYLSNTIPNRKEDYRSAAALVQEHKMPGDLIMLSPGYIEQPFAYYYQRPHPTGVSLESVRDGVLITRVQTDLDKKDVFAGPLLPYLFQDRQRIWLITNTNVFQPVDEELLRQLSDRHQLRQVWELDGVLVRLYEGPERVGRLY